MDGFYKVEGIDEKSVKEADCLSILLTKNGANRFLLKNKK